jgi:cupin-like protein
VNETADAFSVAADTRALVEIDSSAVLSDTFSSSEPVVVRGIAAGWPAVAAAQGSTADIVAYLERFDRGAMAEAFVGPPEIGGRFFYADAPAVFNFERRRGPFKDIVEAIARLETAAEAPVIYIGSTPVAEVLPGFEKENPMPLLDGIDTQPRIWIGNRTVVSAHFDESSNLAVVVAGLRRFTLFPPDQVANLYVGPLDSTMAGQPSSMVDVRAPDLTKFPRFREALAQARVAELGPGDAILIPALWWHHVEALDPFNVLVNYWWKSVPPDAGSAFEAMVHGILAVGALPEREREAWRAMFDHYVFRRNGDPAEHLAPSQKGILGEPTPQLRARIRQFLLTMLSRV